MVGGREELGGKGWVGVGWGGDERMGKRGGEDDG